MPRSAEFDDPEMYPEDEEEGAAPGDPPAEFAGLDEDAESPLVWGDDYLKAFMPAQRQRRLQRVADHIATREYREVRKAELRERRGGRFA